MIFKLLLTIAISAASICMVQGISNGQNAILTDSQHVVYIYISDFFSCAGALVGERHVATVASCFTLPIATGYVQTLKVAGYTLTPVVGISVAVDQLYPHPQYDQETLKFDVAVLKIATAITGAKPIPLCSGEVNKPDKLRVSGLGDVSELEAKATALMQAELEAVIKTECTKALFDSQIESRTKMCAQSTTGAGMCTFDNGGPVVNAKNELCGLMSAREGCGSTSNLTVFTNINVVKLFILASKRK